MRFRSPSAAELPPQQAVRLDHLAVALAQGFGSGGGVAAVVRRERADELEMLLLLLLLVPRRDLRLFTNMSD